jgi:hypothetical protein
MMFPLHLKRLMNKCWRRFALCGFCYVGLDFTQKLMPFPIGRSQSLSQAWHDVRALFVGVWPTPAISPHNLAIRAGCICAQVKQKEYGHGAFLAPQFGQSSKR